MIRTLVRWVQGFDLSPAPEHILVTGPLRLCPPTADDFSTWTEAMSQNEAWLRPRQPTWPAGHLTEQAYKSRLRVYRAQARMRTGFAFHIFKDAAFVGVIRLAPIHYGALQSGIIGYWVTEKQAGQGIATLALAAVSEFAFVRLGLARVEAHCLPDNTASLRVLEKCGFQQEGQLHSFLEINGQRENHLLYACLARSMQEDLAPSHLV